MFLAEGYAVLLPDSRAHGHSGGEFVTYGLLEKYDALDWAHWLQRQGCVQIYGLGESLGASILIQASALEPVFRAIVAECPYADLPALAEYRVRQTLHLPPSISGAASKLVVISGMIYARLRYGLDFTQVTPALSMARTRTPILLIHGTKDFATPCWHSQRLAQANARNVLWLVPNAGHTGAAATDPQQFWRRVLQWFRQ
jgi:dipeptidyl aminopeptidase/acylaminoacyl peptidase